MTVVLTIIKSSHEEQQLLIAKLFVKEIFQFFSGAVTAIKVRKNDKEVIISCEQFKLVLASGSRARE